MTTSAFSRTVATIACTLLFSGAAILSAVGPAQTIGTDAASPTIQRTA